MTSEPIYPGPKAKQLRRVLDVFLKANGAWISSRTLDREYGFTQIHARMKELKEAPYYWPVERSKERGDYRFYSYRILTKTSNLTLI
jgi:hypothetical protein